MLATVSDLVVPEALVGRVAVQLAHAGVAGLGAALDALVEGTAADSAVLRRCDAGQELLAASDDVGRVTSPAREPDGAGVVLSVCAPGGVPLARLTVLGARPKALPLLRDVAALLGLVLAAAAPEHRTPTGPTGAATGGATVLADVEADRAALADTLHDGPLQDLVAARYAADAAVRAGAEPGLRVAVQTALVGLRRVLWQLRPRGSDGLADALGRLSVELVDRGAAPLRLEIRPAADVLPPAAGVAAYRLVQAVAAGAGRTVVTVQLSRRAAPGGRQVLALSVDGGSALIDPSRWRRMAAALDGDLVCTPGRLRLTLPSAPTPSGRGTVPTPKAAP